MTITSKQGKGILAIVVIAVLFLSSAGFFAGKYYQAATTDTAKTTNAMERASLAAQVGGLQARMSLLANRVDTLQAENAELQTNKTTLTSQVSVLQTERDGLSNQVATLTSQLAESKTNLTKWATYTQGLTNQLAGSQAENALLVKQIGDLNAKLTNSAPTQTAGTNVALTANSGSSRLIPKNGNQPTAVNTFCDTNGVVVGGLRALFPNNSSETVHVTFVQGKYSIGWDLAPGYNPVKLYKGDWRLESKRLDPDKPHNFTVFEEECRYEKGFGGHHGGYIIDP